VVEKLYKDRTLINCYGRKRLFLDRWGDSLFKNAYAQIPQSTVADKVNEEGLAYVYNDTEKLELVELLLQVHDEIVYQIPISAGFQYHRTAVQAIEKMLETPVKWLTQEFVIPAESKVGMRWGKENMIKLNKALNIESAFEKVIRMEAMK